MGKLMRWWKKRQSRDKYLKNKAKIGFISTLMEKYLPKKYKGLSFIHFVNTYWQILENSSRNFSELSVFRGMSRADFWKTHPQKFDDIQFL